MTWILLLWEKSFAHLFRIPYFCSRDLWTELSSIHAEHPLVTRGSSDRSISWLLEASPFYNSNFSISNKSTSPFGEAQLDNTKPRSAAMVTGSRRNASHVQLDTTIKMNLETPKTELRLPPSIPRKTFFRQWQVLHGFVPLDSNPSSQTRRPPKRPPRTARIISIPRRPLFLRSRISFCWH